MYSEKAAENTQKSTLQIKEDDKFFCRLLSKETSISNNPSFRLTPPVAVPFLWESHPGTPKHPFSGLSLPPLTPPPSYFYTTSNAKTSKIRPSRSHRFRFSFPRLNLRKTPLLPSSPPSYMSSSFSCSSSSSSDSSRVVVSNIGRRRRFLSCDFSVDLWPKYEEDDDDVADSENPSSCFGFRRSATSNGGFGRCSRRQA